MRVQINLGEQEEECAEMASAALLTHVRAVRRQATCHAAATEEGREVGKREREGKREGRGGRTPSVSGNIQHYEV